MTLRSRLLLLLLGVVAIGLVTSDVVVYTQLRGYLVTQVDGQLGGAWYQVGRAVLGRDGLEPALPFVLPSRGASSHRSTTGTTTAPTTAPGTGTGPGSTGTGTANVTNGGTTGSGRRFTFRFSGGTHGEFESGPANGLFPAGTVGEVLDAHGKVKGKPVTFLYGGKAPGPPQLPRTFPAGTNDGNVFFTAPGRGPNAPTYRVLERPLHYEGLSLVVAIPLTSVGQTTGHLLWIMVLVSVAVLLGMVVLAFWIVRKGLRPLEEMAVTAGVIADGDLAQRVSPAESRTEVGRLGLALNTMLGEIEEAFAARTASEDRLRRFLADASHELRTPLTSIRGYAEIFDLGARERPEDLATAMHHIRHEAGRMSTLVDDLLLLARLDRERPVTRGPVDLAQVVERAVLAARAAFPEHSVEFATSGATTVSGDAERLRQVVDNLVTNAIRHSLPETPVQVRVQADAILQADASADADLGGVVIEVEDAGPGVPPEEADRIFEPFVRADSSRTRATGGAGLGLAIVAAIVREHEGEVGVRSGSGGGAIFFVRIPLTQTASPQGTESQTSGEPGQLHL